MLEQKLIKSFTEETGIKVLDPFYIKGYETPYRITKSGNIERFLKSVWTDSSYAVIDLVALVDNDMISKCTENLIEYKPSEIIKRRKKK